MMFFHDTPHGQFKIEKKSQVRTRRRLRLARIRTKNRCRRGPGEWEDAMYRIRTFRH